LARFWEAPGAQKISKNRKNRVRDGFGTRLGSSIDFGHDFAPILDIFWVDFGRILAGFREDFWKDLTLQTMIRATKGISLDRWVDGWMDFGKSRGSLKLPKLAKIRFRGAVRISMGFGR
jgi:hypothetical protein